MKFSGNLQQRDYFNKNGFVSFEGLLNPHELDVLNQAIDQFFPKSRDLYRDSDAVKKIVFSSKLVHLAYEFLQKKPLRIAFDQVLSEKADPLKVKLTGNETFQDLCCIGGLEGLFLISLKNSSEPKEGMFDLSPGNGILINPTVPYPFFSFAPSIEHRFFLIGYGGVYSQYLYELRDPHCHYLKSLGYVFGDRLNDRDHPILLR